MGGCLKSHPFMQILTDNRHLTAYATDASAYREMPVGVCFPRTAEDVKQLVLKCSEEGKFIIPRAAGTSLAGQVVGRGVVADISRYMTNILEINAHERWAWVEPGVVRDELNLRLKPDGLFFSPETSTSNRCCIGGMMGNNSCGKNSLVYGSTRQHVLEARGVLADGSEEHFKDYSLAELEERFGSRFWEKTEGGSLIENIYAQLVRLHLNPETKTTIEANFPDKSLQRRSCGYAIDEVIAGLPERINLCNLLAGSEGTLAFTTAIKISLDELPSSNNMVVCAHCDTLEKSFLANLTALRHNPVAVELMDGKILELGKGNPEAQRNRFFVEGDPAALIIAEFNGSDIEQNAAAFEADVAKEGLAYRCTRVYGKDVSRVWALRKAGLGVLSGMKGDAKPIGVIEDTAVAPERLPAYMADFRQMMERIGLDCVYYGHISTGELHLRPILNIKTEYGKTKFREVAQESAKLIRKHRGSLSGEHGDGRLRGEFIPVQYGEECYELMRRVKQCWDPVKVFNMNKIVDTPPMDEFLRFEVNQRYLIEERIGDNTCFNWRAAFDECKVEGVSGVRSQTHALMCSIEQCNGAGDCKKSSLMGGTLCPSYKVSERDELQATRGRANILREALTRGIAGKDIDSPEVREALYSCLACKACLAECPSSVDMTRIRAEVLQQLYKQKGTPLRSFLVARMAMVERLGSCCTPIYNFFASNRLTSAVIKKVVQFSSDREIPALSRRSMRKLVKIEARRNNKKSDKRVYLFADEFTNFQEAELGLTFARLLTALGYEVEIPRHVESGRAAISKGCLVLARKFAKRNVGLLKDKISESTPLVGIEPSCILSFRDEYPDLVPAEMRREAIELGRNCLLFDEFIMREVANGNIDAKAFGRLDCEVFLHGHCHQKSLVGVQKTAQMLGLIEGAKVSVIPTSCCGMAGSFGYEKEHYKTSLAIGEMVLFPAVRKAMKESSPEHPTFIVAPGTSCRQQIYDGTKQHAIHPIELLYKQVCRQ